MKRHISYPSIDQLRNVVANVNRQANFVGLDEAGEAIYDPSLRKPTLTFKGTVKLHGTNASVCFSPKSGEIWAQSKENIITPEKDNAGFATFVYKNESTFKELFQSVIEREGVNTNENIITIYGEWVGMGIQKSVAISNLPKSLFIIGVKISPIDNPTDSEHVVDGIKSTAYWVSAEDLRATDLNIYNIFDYPTYSTDIDFNVPQLAQNLLNDITLAVETECPVAKAFGFEGIGEGVVWSTNYKDTVLRFKVKGEKHAGKSKIKSLPRVDDEKINKILEVADSVTPSWRLAQMLEKSCDLNNGGTIDRKHLGEYLRMVVNDVMKEDLDLIVEAGLEPKDVNKYISEIARKYFFEQELV